MKLLALLSATLVLCFVTFGDAALIGGRRTYAHYSRCGLWNDPAVRRGLVIEQCCPADVSYPGSPWQQLSVFYNDGLNRHYRGNAGSCPGYTVLSERALHDANGQVGIEHVFKMGVLTLTKTEQWNFDGQTIRISFKAKYAHADCSPRTRCGPLRNLTVMHAVDPDQDRVFSGSLSTFTTANDVIYNGGRGLFAEATGPSSCQAFGYGICSNRYRDGSTERVGFTRGWDRNPLTGNIHDPNGAYGDWALHYHHNERRDLHCGDEREFFFFVTWARCYRDARQNFLDAHRRFCPCPPFRFVSPRRVPRCRNQCPCPRSRSHLGCTCTGSCPLGFGTPSAYDSSVLAAEAAAPTACDARSRSSARLLAETNPNIRTVSRCAVVEEAASEVRRA